MVGSHAWDNNGSFGKGQGLGFRVLGFRVPGCEIQCLGFQAVGFRSLGSRVRPGQIVGSRAWENSGWFGGGQGVWFRVLGFRAQGSGFGVRGCRVQPALTKWSARARGRTLVSLGRVWVLGFRLQGSGLRFKGFRGLQGYLAHKKVPSPLGPHRASGMVLR